MRAAALQGEIEPLGGDRLGHGGLRQAPGWMVGAGIERLRQRPFGAKVAGRRSAGVAGGPSPITSSSGCQPPAIDGDRRAVKPVAARATR